LVEGVRLDDQLAGIRIHVRNASDLGQRRVPPYAARCRFARSLSVPADGKSKRKEISLLATLNL
jgi:hypothetical protein